MTATTWELEAKGPGRWYQTPKDLVPRYEDQEALIEAVIPQLKEFLKVETSVRFLLDGRYVNPATSVIGVPFEGENDTIYRNIATMVFQQLWGYYLSADPKSTHHGLTNIFFEGTVNNMVRRETEKFLKSITTRNDIGARVMKSYKMACETPAFKRDVYLKQIVSQSLNIHLGVRVYTYGLGVNRVNAFLPIEEGGEAVDRIYYNMEHIVHQNMVSYDENHQNYLPVSEELVLREIENILARARKKQNTRMKLINGLTMHTVMLEDPSQIHHESLADMYYDKLNRVDLLEEAGQRSRDMFASALIRSTEITSAAININNLKLEERMYIDQPKGKAPAKAKAAEPEKVAVTVHKDGLTEL